MIDNEVLGATRVAIDDLDGDGDLDVVSAAYEGGQVGWYENLDGAGQFGAISLIAKTLSFHRFIATEDLDGDGQVEVLVSGDESFDSAQLLIFGRSADGFELIQRVTGGNLVQQVAFFDQNEDGNLDLFAVGENHSYIAIADYIESEGNRFDSFSHLPSRSFRNPSGARDLEIVDIDGDGQRDFIVATAFDSSILWFQGQDDGVIITDQVAMLQDIEAADLDGDGDLDLLSASSHDDKIAWYRNDGTGVFGEQQLLSDSGLVEASLIRSMDVDGDGDLDLVSSSELEQRIVWYENQDGEDSFGPVQTLFREEVDPPEERTVDVPWTIEPVDYDLDGRTDLVGATWTVRDVVNADALVWRNGDEGFELYRPGAPGFTRVVLPGDVDGDGDPDLVSARQSYGDALVWYENVGIDGELQEPHLIDDTLFSESTSLDSY